MKIFYNKLNNYVTYPLLQSWVFWVLCLFRGIPISTSSIVFVRFTVQYFFGMTNILRTYKIMYLAKLFFMKNVFVTNPQSSYGID